MRLIAFTHYREKLVNLMTQQEKLSKGNRKNLNNHKKEVTCDVLCSTQIFKGKTWIV